MFVRKVAVGAFLAVSLAACGDSPPVDPCQVQPTRTNVFGQCVEYDGEACDDDPCDADDLTESDGSGHKKPTAKPKVTKPKTSTTKRR